MPKTLVKNAEGQIIGGMFSNADNANKAILEFRKLGVQEENIQLTAQLNEKEQKQAYSDLLTDREVAETQAAYYDKAIRAGKTLVMIYDVVEPAPIIDIFDKYKAEYNPDGSRNAREDVSGMTAGAAIGTAAGGAVGALVGGPVGAVAGAAAGAVVGAGTGAAAGKAAEHNK
jgi:hypothetical protein